MSILVDARELALPGRLRPASVALAEGQLACLIGPNGGGKTSLLHALAGIGGPAGSVRIDGTDPWRVPPARRAKLLGFLPAARDIAWPLLAGDAIALGGGDPGGIAEAVAALELAPLLDRRLDRLSTGERSRVLIARALAPRPRLLLLDEPTANLDPLWQIRLMEMLRADLRRRSAAALVAIHDLDAAARFADRMLIVDRGHIVADGPAASIIAGPAVQRVFGIVKEGGLWRPLRPPADPRSSP